MKIALLLAPGIGYGQTKILKEYPSILILKSYLERKGYTATTIDLNLELIKKIEEKKEIKQTIKLVEKEIKKIEEKEKITTEELQKYLKAISSIKIIEQSKEPEKEKKAINTCNELIYTPTEIKERKTTTIQKEILIKLFEINKLQEYDLVGISIPFSTNLAQSIELSKLIKKRNPKTKIVIGGKMVSDYINELEEAINKKIIDQYCIGDGEEALIETIKNIEKNKPIAKKIIGKEISITNQITVHKGKETAIYLSKGCFWNKCTFCSRYGMIPDYKIKNINQILKEIEEAIHQGVQEIELITDALPNNYAKKISEFLIKKQYKINWYAHYFRVSPTYDVNTLTKMKESGYLFSKVLIGADGFTNKVLEMENKGYTVKEIKQTLENLRIAKVQVRQINNIFDFPGATLKEELEGLKLMEEYPEVCNKYGNLELAYNSNNLIAKNPEKFGVKIIKVKETNAFGYKYQIIQENGLTKEEKEKLKLRIREISNRQKIINEYKLNPHFSQIKIYNPEKYKLKVKIKPVELEIKTLFNGKGSKINPKTIYQKSNKPISLRTLENQEIIKKLKIGKEYSFEKLNNILRNISKKENNELIQIQKTFQTIIDLAIEEVFEEFIFEIKK